MSRPPPPEPEALPAGKLALAIFVTLAIVAGSVAAARVIERHAQSARRSAPAKLGQSEIGHQFQRPFGLEQTARLSRQRQQERLESYGWVDRKRELIHVPIERAYDAVLASEGEGER